MPAARPARRAISMIEIVVGAIILGVSGVTVLELVRSNTASLQITEVEAVARGMAADLLERFARPSVYDLPGEQKTTQVTLGVPTKWDVALQDGSFSYSFPKDKLAPLLDQYDVTFQLDIQPLEHATFGHQRKMTQVSVKVKWLDVTPAGQRAASGEYREVTYVCLVDR